MNMTLLQPPDRAGHAAHPGAHEEPTGHVTHGEVTAGESETVSHRSDRSADCGEPEVTGGELRGSETEGYTGGREGGRDEGQTTHQQGERTMVCIDLFAIIF